jgi:6-phosphofructokinase
MGGKGFSIVAVSEGALSREDHQDLQRLSEERDRAKTKEEKKQLTGRLAEFQARQAERTLHLTHQLEQRTGLESRLTILGHVQRGGTPSPVDRLLATRLGTGAAQLIADGVYGVMVAARGDGYEPIPLEQVAGKRKTVPVNHPWIESARMVGTCLGD